MTRYENMSERARLHRSAASICRDMANSLSEEARMRERLAGLLERNRDALSVEEASEELDAPSGSVT